jgi:ubiquinone/menaquinone biosynthesis C-methylase UbiE/uncharacterized protein YbaR (Trm112 family)
MGKQLIDPELMEILVCPACKSKVIQNGKQLFCDNSKCAQRYPIINGIPIMLPELTKDLKLSQEKWDQEHNKVITGWKKPDLSRELEPELRDAYNYVRRYTEKYMKSKNQLFLEIGCGSAKLSYLLAKKGIRTVGLDFSLNALRLAKELFRRGGATGFFVCGNILQMPFKDNAFLLSYGGGVLEHVRETQKAVNEVYRITARRGVTVNTIPYLSLSVIYRMLRWGNIPDIPIIRDILEQFEIKILKGKFLRFGYEKSFTSAKIKKIFTKAGFTNIEINLFKTYYPLDIISSPTLKKAVTSFVNSSRLFWPMIYVKGEKIENNTLLIENRPEDSRTH